MDTEQRMDSIGSGRDGGDDDSIVVIAREDLFDPHASILVPSASSSSHDGRDSRARTLHYFQRLLENSAIRVLDKHQLREAVEYALCELLLPPPPSSVEDKQQQQHQEEDEEPPQITLTTILRGLEKLTVAHAALHDAVDATNRVGTVDQAGRLNHVKEKYAKLKTEHARLTRTRAVEQNDLANVRDQLMQIRSANDHGRAEYDQLNHDYTKLNDECDMLRRQMTAAASSDVDRLKRQVAERDATILAMQNRHDTAKRAHRDAMKAADDKHKLAVDKAVAEVYAQIDREHGSSDSSVAATRAGTGVSSAASRPLPATTMTTTTPLPLPSQPAYTPNYFNSTTTNNTYGY